jgi:hypothetical protein
MLISKMYINLSNEMLLEKVISKNRWFPKDVLKIVFFSLISFRSIWSQWQIYIFWYISLKFVVFWHQTWSIFLKKTKIHLIVGLKAYFMATPAPRFWWFSIHFLFLAIWTIFPMD